jgi:hypothetical protein
MVLNLYVLCIVQMLEYYPMCSNTVELHCNYVMYATVKIASNIKAQVSLFIYLWTMYCSSLLNYVQTQASVLIYVIVIQVQLLEH